MKRAERKWLAILVAVAAAAFTGVDASLASEAKNAASESRARLAVELGKKRMNDGERASVKAEIESLKGEASSARELAAVDPVALGSEAKLEFSRHGLEVRSYSVAQGKRASLVEFELEGGAAGLSALFSAEASGDTPFSISRCTLAKADKPGRLQAGIGISTKRSYGKIDNRENGEKAAAFIASISQRPFIAKVASSAPPSPTPSAAPRVDRPAWIAFIGKTMLADGTTQYFLKDSQGGRMLELKTGQSGDSVVSETEDSLTIRYQGALYEIRKK